MSGEGKLVSFKRTANTTKSNKELHKEFSKIILYSPVTKHMKFYGDRFNGYEGTIDLIEHGDESRQKWEQENVAIKDTKHPPASLLPKPNNFPSSTMALKGSFVYPLFGFTVSWCELSNSVGLLLSKYLLTAHTLFSVL